LRSLPEKRTFFLEGLDLLSSPTQAVYTRTITDPRWGSRLTGKTAGFGYTVLVADDAGGGSVGAAGPRRLESRGFSRRDRTCSSHAPNGGLAGRLSARSSPIARRTTGTVITASLVPTSSGAPREAETVTGQLLVSHTTTPNRPDLAAEWSGQTLRSQALDLDWKHNTTHLDVGAGYKDLGDGFRGDVGFVPQVGYREHYHDAGWTVRPTASSAGSARSSTWRSSSIATAT